MEKIESRKGYRVRYWFALFIEGDPVKGSNKVMSEQRYKGGREQVQRS